MKCSLSFFFNYGGIPLDWSDQLIQIKFFSRGALFDLLISVLQNDFGVGHLDLTYVTLRVQLRYH